MVGKVLYFMKRVSPVCASLFCKLCQHLDSHGKSHWCAGEQLLAFLGNNPWDQKLKMSPPMELFLQDVVDSSFTINDLAVLTQANSNSCYSLDPISVIRSNKNASSVLLVTIFPILKG